MLGVVVQELVNFFGESFMDSFRRAMAELAIQQPVMARKLFRMVKRKSCSFHCPSLTPPARQLSNPSQPQWDRSLELHGLKWCERKHSQNTSTFLNTPQDPQVSRCRNHETVLAVSSRLFYGIVLRYASYDHMHLYPTVLVCGFGIGGYCSSRPPFSFPLQRLEVWMDLLPCCRGHSTEIALGDNWNLDLENRRDFSVRLYAAFQETLAQQILNLLRGENMRSCIHGRS